MGSNWKSWDRILCHSIKLWFNPNVLYGTPSNGTTVPLILNNIANEQLTWETTEQLNVGVDFGFLNGRVSGNVDVYNKTTKDLLQ